MMESKKCSGLRDKSILPEYEKNTKQSRFSEGNSILKEMGSVEREKIINVEFFE